HIVPFKCCFTVFTENFKKENADLPLGSQTNFIPCILPFSTLSICYSLLNHVSEIISMKICNS
ncbi:hypothetical protein J9303_17265, partial [Bacillaceae bacterium Marseille-Q3522]|nr:hypothetical protein [Bacillaceae bacterium Marseille-Q3522]